MNTSLKGKLGLPNQYQILDKTTITKTIKGKVDRKKATFLLGLGPCIKDGYKQFLALEIDYTQSQKECSESLVGALFGAKLLPLYADKAKEIAVQYCKKNGLIIIKIIDPILSSSKFSAIVKKM